MMDLNGLMPIFGHPALRPAPRSEPVQIQPVEKSTASGGASGRMDADSSSGQDTPRHRTNREGEPLTGPPPAFQVSLLDLEVDLQRAIAGIEAARGHEAFGAAVRPAEGVDGVHAQLPDSRTTAPPSGPEATGMQDQKYPTSAPGAADAESNLKT
jgi:hypothetical protein